MAALQRKAPRAGGAENLGENCSSREYKRIPEVASLEKAPGLSLLDRARSTIKRVTFWLACHKLIPRGLVGAVVRRVASD